MSRSLNRALSVLLSFALVMSTVPAEALAEALDDVAAVTAAEEVAVESEGDEGALQVAEKVTPARLLKLVSTGPGQSTHTLTCEPLRRSSSRMAVVRRTT